MLKKKINKGAAKKQNTLNKQQKNIKQQPQKKVQDNSSDSEIPSDDISINEFQAPNEEGFFIKQQKRKKVNIQIILNFLEMSLDEQRLSLAKQILKDAKLTAKKQRQLGNDDFFEMEDQENAVTDDYAPVQKSEQNDVTQILQNKLLKQRQMVFENLAEKVSKNYEDQEDALESFTFKGHKRCITCLQFDYLNNYLYSASKDISQNFYYKLQGDLVKQAKNIFSYGKDKDPEANYDEILALDLSFDGKFLVTAGKDRMIKLWDTLTQQPIYTFKGHKETITGVKFQTNSNVFCTIANDKSFKMWDAGERIYLDTFYGHKSEINSIDVIDSKNFITGGYDKQAIYWNIDDATQLLFSKGHDYSIDCVKSLNENHFVTGSQDGSLSLWNIKRKKPILVQQNLHGENKWITALGGVYNSDLLASGSQDSMVQLYRTNFITKEINKIAQLPSYGIVNDLKFSSDGKLLASCEGDEHKFGRWITSKSKNLIRIYKLQKDSF